MSSKKRRHGSQLAPYLRSFLWAVETPFIVTDLIRLTLSGPPEPVVEKSGKPSLLNKALKKAGNMLPLTPKDINTGMNEYKVAALRVLRDRVEDEIKKTEGLLDAQTPPKKSADPKALEEIHLEF